MSICQPKPKAFQRCLNTTTLELKALPYSHLTTLVKYYWFSCDPWNFFVLNISFPCTDALSSIKNSYQRYVSLSPFCFLLQGFPYKKCLRLFYLPEEKRVIFRSYVSAKYSLKTGDLHRTFTATHFHVPEHHWNRTWKKWEGSVSQEINAMCSTYFQYYTWHFWL